MRDRARFTSDIDVVKAIRAALEVLGQRITFGQADDLAAALPADFKRFLKQSPLAQPFGIDEFLAQIADREGVDPATAEEHARAVLSTLADNAPKDELVDTFEQLPKEIRNLFMRTGKAA